MKTSMQPCTHTSYQDEICRDCSHALRFMSWPDGFSSSDIANHGISAQTCRWSPPSGPATCKTADLRGTSRLISTVVKWSIASLRTAICHYVIFCAGLFVPYCAFVPSFSFPFQSTPIQISFKRRLSWRPTAVLYAVTTVNTLLMLYDIKKLLLKNMSSLKNESCVKLCTRRYIRINRKK